MQSRASNDSVNSSLKFYSRLREGLQGEGVLSLGKAGTAQAVVVGDIEGRGGTFRSSWYLVILWTGLIR